MRAIYLAFTVTTIFATSAASAEPSKVQYDLQERCGIRAEEVFKSHYGGGGVSNTETGQRITSYQNHYSAKLNKCFFLEITIFLNTKETDKGISTTMTLFDLNDHKEYGTFYMYQERDFSEGYGTFTGTIFSPPFPCSVKSQLHDLKNKGECHSESEWREWLKPYMEE
jgi:hypothetical protein